MENFYLDMDSDLDFDDFDGGGWDCMAEGYCLSGESCEDPDVWECPDCGTRKPIE